MNTAEALIIPAPAVPDGLQWFTVAEHGIPEVGAEVIGGLWYTDPWLKPEFATTFMWGQCRVVESKHRDFKDGKQWHTFGPSHNQITHWARINTPGQTSAPAPAVPQGVPAQEVIDSIEAWKSAWLKVPPFADRVNKATREAITISHNSLFLLLHSAQQAQRMPAACPTPTGCGPHGCHGACIAATQAPAPAQERCSTCGYLTSEREHLGCLRRAVKDLDIATGGPHDAQGVGLTDEEIEAIAKKQLRNVMKLADEYAQACAEPNSYTPELSRKQARRALKAKIKELIDAKA